jgi:redox-sensitive bicupin YhaK (pirin superfamily)
MSVQPGHEPACAAREDAVALVITPRERDLGGFSVRRVLPAPEQRMIGPFVFFDEMGPATFPPGRGIDVRPHPHIGIATITYLFDGLIMHRDDLGFEQPIEAGAVNLMTAGRGIVHSERAGPDRADLSTMHGIQSWIALPDALEETDPDFTHYPATALPEIQRPDAVVRVIMGSAFGRESPVKTYSPTLYLDVTLEAGGRIALQPDYDERGLYLVSGVLRVDDTAFERGSMLVARPGSTLEVEASAAARLMIVGGAPVGERHLWWNFVSGRPERIEQAKEDWRQGRFGKIAGDEEFIPLPE